jgi:hypothetical protein
MVQNRLFGDIQRKSTEHNFIICYPFWHTPKGYHILQIISKGFYNKQLQN